MTNPLYQPNPNRIFFDTEFYDDGYDITLISIGMVREGDGAVLYRENAFADIESIADESPWMAENVIPKLTKMSDSPKDIRDDIQKFCGSEPQFWAYYGAYDWFLLNRLFGSMLDAPKGWPQHYYDLKQEADRYGIRFPPMMFGEHNALQDALWNRDSYRVLLDNK